MTIQKGDYVRLEGLSPREIREVARAFEAAGAERGRGWPYEDGAEHWEVIGWFIKMVSRTHENVGKCKRLLTYAEAVGYTPGEGETFEAFVGGAWRRYECTTVGEEWVLALDEHYVENLLRRFHTSMRPDLPAAFVNDFNAAKGNMRETAEAMIKMGWRKEE